jgi:hypothetical protein
MSASKSKKAAAPAAHWTQTGLIAFLASDGSRMSGSR